MFRPSGLFKAVGCPKLATCSMQNCLFSHAVEAPAPAAAAMPASVTSSSHTPDPPAVLPTAKESANERSVTPPPPKRRRIDNVSSSASLRPPIKSILKKPPNGAVPSAADLTADGMPSSNHSDASFESENGRYVKIETTDHRTGTKTKTRIEMLGPGKTTLPNAAATTVSRKPDHGQHAANVEATDLTAVRTMPKTQKTGLSRIIARPHATSATSTPPSSSTTLSSRGTRALHSTTDKKNTVAPKHDATTPALMAWGTKVSKPPEEILTPRPVPKPPAGWDTRYKMLQELFNQYIRLDPSSKERAIRTALDEEEAAALKDTKAYPVTMRLRLYALHKLTPEAYAKQLEEKRLAEAAEATKDPDSMETGLTPEDEARAIAGYVHSFAMLKLYDYIVIPPSDTELVKAKEGVAAANGEEECERCKARFQVLQQKDPETGLWTTNGKCTHHHGKAWSNERGGPRVWQCCQQVLGETVGCTDGPTHVFMVKNAPRLASLWQFVDTPAPADETTPNEDREKAVCVDCEMAYTTEGFEMIRMTATRFPTFETVVDILVHPFGELLDLNTRFSGVTQSQWDSAPAYKPDTEYDDDIIPKAITPLHARDILFKHIDASTILIGHSLENDLKCLRIIHPRVVDTAILYPRKYMPARYSLKHLVKNHLGRFIQSTDGGKGHDSKEDANEAGNLVRKKLMSDVRSGKIGLDGVWAVTEALDVPLKTENLTPATAA
ncbi:hypothetical protein ABW21_db0209857 [Orbilia brochopaga]|nr:hypothetical protein ABW21_db0209857 [Drechslerella brochopaga]